MTTQLRGMMTKKRVKVFRFDRLRSLEGEFNGSQEDFAAQFGMEQSQMNRYLTGKSEPAPELIKRIAEKCKVRADWLLGLTNDRELPMTKDQLTPREKRVVEAMRLSEDGNQPS